MGIPIELQRAIVSNNERKIEFFQKTISFLIEFFFDNFSLGNGDMAMSNTLGANTLDVLLCLGLPWMIRTLMTGKDVEIESGALAYSVMSIIICVIGFFSVTAYYKFQLNKKVGAACLIMYTLFLAIAILMETNVFFHVNLPMCDSWKIRKIQQKKFHQQLSISIHYFLVFFNKFFVCHFLEM